MSYDEWDVGGYKENMETVETQFEWEVTKRNWEEHDNEN